MSEMPPDELSTFLAQYYAFAQLYSERTAGACPSQDRDLKKRLIADGSVRNIEQIGDTNALMNPRNLTWAIARATLDKFNIILAVKPTDYTDIFRLMQAAHMGALFISMKVLNILYNEGEAVPIMNVAEQRWIKLYKRYLKDNPSADTFSLIQLDLSAIIDNGDSEQD